MALSPLPGQLQIDATLGGGGHAVRILEANSPDGRLLGLDADQAAIARCQVRLAAFGERATLRQANFEELDEVAPAAGFGAVDGILFDLGLSSFQLADDERGFSFRSERTARPALRRQPRPPGLATSLATSTSASWRASCERYGEEPHAGRIARAIVDAAPAGADRDRRPAGRAGRARRARAARPPPHAPRDARPSRPCASRSTASWTSCRAPLRRRSTCCGPAAGWPSSPTTRSRTASSSASWPPSGAAASARRRCRSASAAGRRDCAPSAPRRASRPTTRSPPTHVLGARDSGPLSDSRPEVAIDACVPAHRHRCQPWTSPDLRPRPT